FLANMRATIISALALPTSIIASFILMYALNFTLNMMSLLALSLAVGLLIDDAIVVIENIYRHLKRGETPMEAAKSASSEIGLAVLATTFTIVAVFIPIAFMKGIVGRFFYEFGLTISAAVLVSLFVAFTLTPMLSSKWLKAEDEDLSNSGGPIRRGLYFFNHMFEWLSGVYQRQLRWALKHRKTIVIASIAAFVGSMMLMGMLGAEFFPNTDRNEFTVSVTAAPGSSLEQTSNICAQIEKEVKKYPEVTTILTTIGSENDPVTKGNVLVKLVKKKERVKSDKQIMNDLRTTFKKIPGANISFSTEGMGGETKPLSYSIRGNDINKLSKIADKLKVIMQNTQGVVDIENSLELSKPELKINIDRHKASDLGVNPYLLAASVRAMVDGDVSSQFKDKDEQIDIRVRLREQDRKNLSDISLLSLKSNKKGPMGEDILVPISDVAQLSQGVGPSLINRYARQREITLDANLNEKLLGVAMAEIQKETDKIKLEPGYSINIVGSGQDQEESFGNMLLSLMLAIVFVYIVLAAQFESFIHPFSIMIALPMSMIGAVITLLIFKSSLSVISMIGIIMLMGLVTKNGILLVDFTNVLRERGLSRFEALAQAGPTRLRPILMTTFAMVFGMIPVALGLGEGSEFRSPMGQAVIGGLITSTFLTLFIVPVVYSILDDFSKFKIFSIFKKKKKQISEEEVEPVLIKE
ncbi:MAG: efflux RND transporter permease subunit, partial [Bacteroidota bacterium]|nr:efflux RND transporter permease subunit [Bacteroidota bacterium]